MWNKRYYTCCLICLLSGGVKTHEKLFNIVSYITYMFARISTLFYVVNIIAVPNYRTPSIAEWVAGLEFNLG